MGMNYKRVVCLLVAGVLAVGGAFAQEIEEEKPSLYELPHLFRIPTTEVLDSVALGFSGGGTSGVEKKPNAFGSGALGLGNIAQISLATKEFVNNLQKGPFIVPSLGFKLSVIDERRFLPACTIGLEFSPFSALSGKYKTVRFDPLLGEERTFEDRVEYETKFVSVYLVAGKKTERYSAYAGIKASDQRVRDFFVEGSQNLAVTGEDPYYTYSGMLGLKRKVNPKTFLMLEIGGVPCYEYNEAKKDIDIRNEYASIGGVRFYFTDWLSIDAGIKYQTDYKGLADANVHANLNVVIPTVDVLDALYEKLLLPPIPAP